MLAGGDGVEFENWFAARLSELRGQKGVSARDMSLSLGQSASYINKIENKRTMPSMEIFIYICEYLNITPAQFFDTELHSPSLSREIAAEAAKLTPKQAEHILSVIKDLNERN